MKKKLKVANVFLCQAVSSSWSGPLSFISLFFSSFTPHFNLDDSYNLTHAQQSFASYPLRISPSVLPLDSETPKLPLDDIILGILPSFFVFFGHLDFVD